MQKAGLSIARMFAVNAGRMKFSRGHFDILFTRPLATTLLVVALTVMVLPAIVPSVKRLLGTVGEETGT